MAIGSSAWKLVVDATKFAEGTTLSRNELKFLRQTLRETATDTQMYSAGVDQLTALHAKGALTTDQYEQSMAKLRDEVQGPTTSAFDKLKESIIPTIDVVGAANMAFSGLTKVWDLAVSAGSKLVDVVKNQFDEIDRLVNQASNLGIATKHFQILANAAELADIPMASVGNSVEKMLIAISRGEDGAKKFEKTFEMLRLDAAALQAMAPQDAFRQILVAMQGIGNQADRVRVAKEIFGNPDVLRMSADAIDDAAKRLEQFGGLLEGVDVTKFSEADDAMVRLDQNLNSVAKRVTVELTPAIKEFGVVADEALRFAGSKEFLGTIKEAADLLLGLVAAEREAAGMQADIISGAAGLLIPKEFKSIPLSKRPVTAPPDLSQRNSFSELGRQIRASRELDEKLREATGRTGASAEELQVQKAIEKNTREKPVQINEVTLN